VNESKIQTYFHVAALVVIVVTAMGAGSLTLWEALAVATALLLLPWFVGRLLLLFRKPSPEPLDGGDVVLRPGRPGPGGKPGQIRFEHYAAEDYPFLCFRNVDYGLDLQMFMGTGPPDPESLAAPGSVYVLLGTEPALYVKQKSIGGWVPMLGVR